MNDKNVMRPLVSFGQRAEDR